MSIDRLPKTISVCFPRSGHHLLTNALARVFGDDMKFDSRGQKSFQAGELFYCEKYAHCQSNPCLDPRTNYQKDHDFDLQLEPSGEFQYLVQVRQPLPSIVSRFQLECRNGFLADSYEQWVMFLQQELRFWRAFYQKWIAASSTAYSKLIVQYEQFIGNPHGWISKAAHFLSPHHRPDMTKLQRVVDSLDIRPDRNLRDFKYFDDAGFSTLGATANQWKEQVLGAWTEDTHQRLHRDNLNVGLAKFILESIKPASYLEFGSGIGQLARYIAEHGQLRFIHCIEPLAIDGYYLPNHPGPKLFATNIFVDPEPAELQRRYDLIVSIEVAEHIPAHFHCQLFDFLTEHAEDFIVFSAARPGQGGHGHVSERPEFEWKQEFLDRSFEFCEEQTQQLRGQSDKKNVNHCRNLMVFRRQAT